MILKSISFVEDEGTVQEWFLEGLELGAKNLIVGKNATGKTRTLNIILVLSRYLSGLQQPSGTAKYELHFLHKNKDYYYSVNYKKDEIITEVLKIDGTVYLERFEGGVGNIWAEDINNGSFVRFQSPVKDFAAVSRRDSIQHNFLEPLYTWASNLRYFPFNTQLGKDHISFIVPNAPIPDERDFNAALGIFRQASKTFEEKYVKSLLKDLAKIDYKISEIGASIPYSVRVLQPSGEGVGLYVKETDLPGITDQFSMSTGMFRVLSLLIQINYNQFKKLPSTILIDDIGEGLDFDRSCRLIDLLRAKAETSDIQIVLSTNDRFVMNNVPLEEWSVLQRKKNKVSVRNQSNSSELFKEFKFTGLSNFSLLEYDFLNQVVH